jgi:hypothetical protein
MVRACRRNPVNVIAAIASAGRLALQPIAPPGTSIAFV